MDFPLLDDPTEQERQLALANALRRQQTMGVVAQITGDPVLSKVGGGLVQSAEHGQQQALGQQQHRLQLALAAQKEKELQQYRMDQLAQHKDEITQRGQDRLLSRAFLKEQQDARLAAGQIPKPPTAAGAQKDWGDFEKAIGTGARGSLSKELQKSINSSEALETLLKLPNGALLDATPQQMREAYTALNSLIAKGGSQAVSQIEHLAPETMASQFANLKQTLLNEPQSAHAKAFIENILETAKRESDLARKQLRRQQMEGVPNFTHLRKADKNRFDSMLKGVHLDPAAIDDNGLEIAAAPAPGAAPGTKQIVKYLVSPDKTRRVPIYADGSEGPEESAR